MVAALTPNRKSNCDSSARADHESDTQSRGHRWARSVRLGSNTRWRAICQHRDCEAGHTNHTHHRRCEPQPSRRRLAGLPPALDDGLERGLTGGLGGRLGIVLATHAVSITHLRGSPAYQIYR